MVIVLFASQFGACVMSEEHEARFIQLVAEGHTLRFICKALADEGCDLSAYSQTFLVLNMVRALRGQPLVWSME